MFVQFSDSKGSVIVATFSSEQSSENYQNLGEVDDDDPRLIDFLTKTSQGMPSSLAAALSHN